MMDGGESMLFVIIVTPVGVIVTTSFLFRLAYSIYNGKHIPCPQRESLMSPTVSQSMTEWSDCTRKQIDAMYDRREEKGENCFFT